MTESAKKPLDILLTVRSQLADRELLTLELGVTFREDDCCIRDENAALNMSWMRKFALGLLKNERSFNKSQYQKKTIEGTGRPRLFD